MFKVWRNDGTFVGEFDTYSDASEASLTEEHLFECGEPTIIFSGCPHCGSVNHDECEGGPSAFAHYE